MSAALRTSYRVGKGFSPGSGGRKTTEAETAGASGPGFLLWSHVLPAAPAGSSLTPHTQILAFSMSFRLISLIVNSVNIGPLSLSHWLYLIIIVILRDALGNTSLGSTIF